MGLPKRFAHIYVLSLGLALSGCITASNNLDSSDKASEEKNTESFKPASGQLATLTNTEPSRNATEKKGARFKPISLAQIVGQNKSTLIKILGKPSFKRSDRPAEIWRYRHKACLLDIYLYRPLQADADAKPLVNYVEARTTLGPRAATLPCLNIIRRRFVKNKLGWNKKVVAYWVGIVFSLYWQRSESIQSGQLGFLALHT